MKNCTGCGAPASDEIKFCSECGQPFGIVDVIATTTDGNAPSVAASKSHAPRPSVWAILSAICLVALVGMFGWQQFRASKLDSCRAQAPLIWSFKRVLDVRLNGFECEYLMKSVSEYSTEKVPEWEPQHIMDMYLKMEKDVSNQ